MLRTPRIFTTLLAARLLIFAALASCSKHKPAPTADNDCDVVVVGAGLAGLTAAYQLQKAGLRVMVLEERPVLGGRVATATYGNNVVGEYGMQEIWRDSPLVTLARELKVPLDTPEPAFSSVLIDGRPVAFTQSSGSDYLQALLGEQEAAKLAAWLDRAAGLYERSRRPGLSDPDVAHLQDISFAAWVAESGLSAKAVTWLRLTLEGELASEAENFSALSALLDMEMFFGKGLENFHVQGGNLRVIEALAQPLGDRLHTGAVATGVRRSRVDDGSYQVRVDYEKNHHVQTLRARRVVLAVPWVRLHQIMMEPPLPDAYWQSVGSLHFGHYVVVHFLAPDTSRSLMDTSIFPVLAGGPLGVIYGLDHNPEGGEHDVFGLLVYGEAARQFHMVPRPSRVADIRTRLHKLWPAYTATLGDAFVYSYHPTALPVWPPGRSPIDALSQTLRTPHMGLHLAGDYTHGAHATAAVTSGLQVARTIVAELR